MGRKHINWAWIPIGLAALSILFGGWFIVDAGESAIVLRFGAVNRTAHQGFHIKWPIVERSVVEDVRIKLNATTSEGSSFDLQTVNATIALNYYPQADRLGDLYSDLGRRKQWENNIIAPNVLETFKAVAARYDAEELITQRNKVSNEIEDEIRTRLESFGLLVAPNGFSITDFKFSDVFNEAIESKQQAEQFALKAEHELAKAKQDALKEIEYAKAQAEALRLQAAHITPELIELRRVEAMLEAVIKWNGEPPKFMGGNAIPMFDIAQAQE